LRQRCSLAGEAWTNYCDAIGGNAGFSPQDHATDQIADATALSGYLLQAASTAIGILQDNNSADGPRLCDIDLRNMAQTSPGAAGVLLPNGGRLAA